MLTVQISQTVRFLDSHREFDALMLKVVPRYRVRREQDVPPAKEQHMEVRKTLYNSEDSVQFRNETYSKTIEEHNKCCLCGAGLIFSYEVDPQAGYLVEESQCPECLVRTKANGYSIQ